MSPAGAIKLLALSSEDGANVAGVTNDGRLKVNADGDVNVGNFPLTPGGRLMVESPAPEGATLLQSLDVEITAETDEVSPWVDASGFTRFILVTRTNMRTDHPNGDFEVILNVRESPDGVLDYGHMQRGFGSGPRTTSEFLLNEIGEPCVTDCPRIEFRRIHAFEGDFFFLGLRLVAQTNAPPAHIEAMLYGLP